MPGDQAVSSPTSRKSRTSRSDRPTIGFLLASLHTGASQALWPGLVHAAEKHDANLICFPGGRLRSSVAYEAQRNVIFDLAGEDCLDGLVTWSSSLGGVLGPVETNAFHNRYQPLPMVSLAQFMEGTPTVSVDSYQGMRSLLRHLIEDHQFNRLAFIRGPERHFPAQERYRAYLDMLQSYNLPLIPELITRPLRWEAGAEAIQMLLDERGLKPGIDFQAIVAVSDLLALWALKTLQARGFQVPRDVAVTGFNNSIEERLATPPLTTVDLPFFNQGAKSIEVLLSQLRGETVPALITLPSELIVRQSCGCPSAAVTRAAFEPGRKAARKKGASPSFPGKECLAGMIAAAGPGHEELGAQVKSVFEAFLLDLKVLHKGGKPRRFLPALEESLDQAVREGRELARWHDVLSVLRRWALPGISTASRASVEVLLSQARVSVSEASERSHSFWEWQAKRQADNLRETGQALLTTFDVDQLTDVLVEYLPRLGIASAYLALYEDPAGSLEHARLVLAYTDQKRLPLEAGGRRFAARQLVPLDMLPRSRRFSLVVEPLYFQEKSLGYVVLEVGPLEGEVYELLRSNLSSALQGALLFQEIQQARLTAEKADRIKTRLLANVSHELRTPLNIILGYTRNALQTHSSHSRALPSELVDDLQDIQQNAEHQLRVINDLLDLSRAEIDELDLVLELLDPLPLLSEAFHGLAGQSTSQAVTWKLDLPERLPLIRADALRLRQIFLNLLSNARKFTSRGQITLGAEVAPPKIHFWVSDTGVGIPADQQERIFEPFVTIEHDRHIAGGIGLGLSITRHLVALHGGTMTLESQPGKGSTFHIYLPLPALEAKLATSEDSQPILLYISSTDELAPAIAEMCRRQGLETRPLRSGDDLEAILTETRPVAFAWDLSTARPGDWALVRRLRHYPRLTQVPFILYGRGNVEGTGTSSLQIGLTGFVVKSAESQSLLDAINAVCPVQDTGPVLIVDDDPQDREAHRALVERGLANYPTVTAADGKSALAAMAETVPALVLLDLVMPEMGGLDVLDRMRADPHLRQVPVIILSNKVLSLEDVKRLEGYTRVTFQSKGLWSESEAVAAMNRMLFGSDALPAYTSGLVKRSIAYLHQNYTRTLSRWEIAEAVGVSEDYLSRVFSRELGVSPWDYLNRYRILHAKVILQETQENIGVIARMVGFKDQAYFSRVFRKLTKLSPQAFRDHGEEAKQS
jgi:signal transduction histidine kinase/DNA-binding LacI/PurR family transcriptional regulator/AraC-like DNA-binding protein/DNA-binding response OmpR family regulator